MRINCVTANSCRLWFYHINLFNLVNYRYWPDGSRKHPGATSSGIDCMEDPTKDEWFKKGILPRKKLSFKNHIYIYIINIYIKITVYVKYVLIYIYICYIYICPKKTSCFQVLKVIMKHAITVDIGASKWHLWRERMNQLWELEWFGMIWYFLRLLISFDPHGIIFMIMMHVYCTVCIMLHVSCFLTYSIYTPQN